RAHQDGTTERTTRSLAEGVACPHGTEVAHQRDRMRVAYDHPILVDYRQRETGALKQAADRAELGKRGDPRRCATGCLRLGRRKARPQLRQGVAAEERGDEEAIRLQGAPDLREGAGKIAGEL